MLGREIRPPRCDGLELDERPEILDLIQMDADRAVEKQPSALAHDAPNADRARERGACRGPVVDLDDVVAALVLLWAAGTFELDEMWSPRLLLAQLQPAVRHREVGVLLDDVTVIFGSELATCL